MTNSVSISPDRLEKFNQCRFSAIETVTARFYSAFAAEYERFGAPGRKACREDIEFHLQFLRPVLEFGLLQPYTDYVSWLGEVLASRNISSTHPVSYTHLDVYKRQACDLKKWLQIMEAFENGGHAYHATMPTDALAAVRDVMLETEAYGFDKLCAEQYELGRQVRQLLVGKGFQSVAAEGFQAPGVVVSYTTDPDLSLIHI